MKASISSRMEASIHRMWPELQRTGSLVHVASPILVFRPQAGHQLPAEWQVGNTYALDLHVFHILPLGKHFIHVNKIDHDAHEIFTNEHGSLTKTWNHRILVNSLDDSSIFYTDEIEIEAGFLTPFIWIFAHIFYRHRQRRWKQLLSIKQVSSLT